MIQKRTLRVSIVIPVYNEADRITACLQAIAVQTTAPYEVIVVDNNSTDDTIARASLFPFVKLLREPRQGVVYARERGFDAASGDIIGRIDADSIIDLDWVQTLATCFAQHGVDAVTGAIRYNDMAAASLLNRSDLFWRRRMARTMKQEFILQGANMALRRQVWRQVKPELCHRQGLHEDFDIAIHIARQGGQVAFAPQLGAAVGLRCCASSYRDFCRYFLVCTKTYAQHGLKSRRHMYPPIALVLLAYLPLRILHAGYSKRSGFSFNQLLRAETLPRVNPATFVE